VRYMLYLSLIYSGLLDAFHSSSPDYNLHYELLICQYMYILALQPLFVRSHRVYWDSMRKQSSHYGNSNSFIKKLKIDKQSTTKIHYFTWNFRTNYQKFVGEGILINCIGLLFILFGGLSVYLVTQERYRRLPRPEDDVLLSR